MFEHLLEMGSRGHENLDRGLHSFLVRAEKLVSPDVPAVPSRYCTTLPTVFFGTVLILSPREIMLVIDRSNSAARAPKKLSFGREAEL